MDIDKLSQENQCLLQRNQKIQILKCQRKYLVILAESIKEYAVLEQEEIANVVRIKEIENIIKSRSRDRIQT